MNVIFKHKKSIHVLDAYFGQSLLREIGTDERKEGFYYQKKKKKRDFEQSRRMIRQTIYINQLTFKGKRMSKKCSVLLFLSSIWTICGCNIPITNPPTT